MDHRVDPTLVILHIHFLHRADRAGGDHAAHLPHHRIAGVGVRDRENQLARLRAACDRLPASAAVEVTGFSQMTWKPPSISFAAIS